MTNTNKYRGEYKLLYYKYYYLNNKARDSTKTCNQTFLYL